MIILDTNVLSEVLRPTPSEAVAAWMRRQAVTELFTTAICEAEILHGIAAMPAGRRRAALQEAAATIFAGELGERVLPFNRTAAQAYADIAVARKEAGRPITEFDAQIAAIARAHRAIVATRNVADFVGCGIRIVDPWDS